MSTAHSTASRAESLPHVSVIIVNFNGKRHLQTSLPAVLRQQYPAFDVILVDNDSTDGSSEYVRQAFPEITLIQAPENRGFGHGNNLGAQQATGEYLAFLNPDTEIAPGWLEALVRALEDSSAGLATAKILLMDQPDRINTCGNDVHFTGIPACRKWMLPADEVTETEVVCSISGAAFVMRRSVFDQLGGFDDGFFLYAEDNDLSWRAQMAGFDSICVPSSVVYHQYVPQFSPDKFFYLERNRYQMLIKNLAWKTLAVLVPALLLSEIVTWGYAVLNGRQHISAKLNGYRWLLANRREILANRQRVQARKSMRDRDLLRRCSFRLAYGLANDGLVSKVASWVFDPLFFVMYSLSLLIIRW